MSGKRFSIVKNELDFYFDVNDTEKRWEIGDVELDNLPVFEDLVDLLNDLNDDNCQLKQKSLDMEMDRDDYRTKSSSLEEGYLQLQRENEKLRKENQALKDANEGLTGTIAHYIDEEGLIE